MKNNNISNLRVISATMVIVIHISSSFVLVDLPLLSTRFIVGNIFDSLSRISVPLFVLISGALNITNSKNEDVNYYYRKTFKRVIVPTIIFSFLYIVYRYSSILLNSILFNNSISIVDLIKPMYSWFSGSPFYHLWYLYMMIPMYLITPYLVKLFNNENFNKFYLTSILLLLLGFILGFTSDLFWVIRFIEFLGYYIFGACLYQKIILNNNKSNKHGYLNMFIGLSFLLINMVLTYLVVKFNVEELSNGIINNLYFYEYTSPLVILSSLFIFSAFLLIRDSNFSFKIIDNNSFYIYIIHAGLIDLIKKTLLINNIDILTFNPWLVIPVFSLVILLLSLLVSIIIKLILETNLSIRISSKIESVIDNYFQV